MPRGIPNKKPIVTPKVEKKEEPVIKKEPVKETVHVETKKEEIKKSVVLAPTAPKLEPLGPGQKYFETPEGDIIIGEADKDKIWSRKMNGGKGGWCNPKR